MRKTQSDGPTGPVMRRIGHKPDRKGDKKMKQWEEIASYMNDEIRERVHSELAPCTEEKFLGRYLELDPDFSELLKTEFGIIAE